MPTRGIASTPRPSAAAGRRRTFLGAHWSTIAAIDFTTVEEWCRHGLVTVYILFAIELRGRRVHFAGMTPSPDEAWVRQVGRNLTDPIDGFFCEKRFCLMIARRGAGLDRHEPALLDLLESRRTRPRR